MSNSDHVDDLFGPKPSAPPASAAPSSEPRGSTDARRDVRMHVKWAARVLQPDGTVVPLTVRDISERGVGLISDRPIAQHATIRVAMAVPDINTPGRFTTVIGSVKTAHVTVSGPDLIYGGVWLTVEGNGTDLIQKWARKLRP